MTLTDPIGDMFSRIRNGQMRSLNSIEIPSSNFRKNILEILKKEGYIKDYYIEKLENNKINLKINLKYYEGDPVIKDNSPFLLNTITGCIVLIGLLPGSNRFPGLEALLVDVLSPYLYAKFLIWLSINNWMNQGIPIRMTYWSF